MFGYIKPCKTKLDDASFEKYKAYYCGLCKYINNYYSFFARGFLHFDCAYLYILYASLSNEEPIIKTESCAFNPLKKKQVAYSLQGPAAAAINILMTKGKLSDNIADDKNIFAYLLHSGFSPVWKRAQSRYFEVARYIDFHQKNLSIMEKDTNTNIDIVANEAALLLANAVVSAPYFEIDSDNLFNFSYNIGRWVYLIDALDDIKSDKKKKRYNPILATYGEENYREQMEYSLFFSLKQASYYYSKMDILRNADILDNIIYLGLPGITKNVLLGNKVK